MSEMMATLFEFKEVKSAMFWHTATTSEEGGEEGGNGENPK